MLRGPNELLELDPRSGLSPPADVEWELIANLHLPLSTPDDVKKYFEVLQTLCLYGRYQYMFYSVAYLLSFFLLELALVARLKDKKRTKRDSLQSLLREAKKRGLLKDEKFSGGQWRKIRAEYREQETGTVSNLHPYVELLEGSLRNLRGSAAHPTYIPTLPPHYALSQLRLCSELICQLWTD